MCDCCSTSGCQNPKELLTKPEDCTPEQVIKCHGELKDLAKAPEKKEK